jgi:hypothetical protein
MTTADAGRSTSNQRRAPRALGTVAGVVIAVATVVIGAQVLGVTPPSGDFSPYYQRSSQCVWPAANPLVPQGRPNPLAQDKPRWGIPEYQPGRCLSGTPTTAPDPMRVPADESKPPQPDFQPTSHGSDVTQ